MRQRHNECLLAALCKMVGADYEAASDAFKVRTGLTWWEWWECHHSTLAWFDFVDTHIAPGWGVFLAMWQHQQQPIGLSTEDNLSGVGLIIITDGQHLHALSFADGVVYNPNEDTSGSLAEILAAACYKGWRLHSILRVP